MKFLDLSTFPHNNVEDNVERQTFNIVMVEVGSESKYIPSDSPFLENFDKFLYLTICIKVNKKGKIHWFDFDRWKDLKLANYILYVLSFGSTMVANSHNHWHMIFEIFRKQEKVNTIYPKTSNLFHSCCLHLDIVTSKMKSMLSNFWYLIAT